MLALEAVPPTNDELIASIHEAHARVGREELQLLLIIAQMPERDEWQTWGAHDHAHWLSMTLGISYWKARGMIVAARALEELPRTSQALQDVVSASTRSWSWPASRLRRREADLIGWAEGVSGAAIRHRADLEIKKTLEVALATARLASDPDP